MCGVPRRALARAGPRRATCRQRTNAWYVIQHVRVKLRTEIGRVEGKLDSVHQEVLDGFAGVVRQSVSRRRITVILMLRLTELEEQAA